jgi:hypothetical protein
MCERSTPDLGRQRPVRSAAQTIAGDPRTFAFAVRIAARPCPPGHTAPLLGNPAAAGLRCRQLSDGAMSWRLVIMTISLWRIYEGLAYCGCWHRIPAKQQHLFGAGRRHDEWRHGERRLDEWIRRDGWIRRNMGAHSACHRGCRTRRMDHGAQMTRAYRYVFFKLNARWRTDSPRMQDYRCLQ